MKNSCLGATVLLVFSFILCSISSSSAMAQEAATLTIVDLNQTSEALVRFQQDYPNVTLNASALLFEEKEEYIMQLLTRDDTVDIYSITVDTGLFSLKEKGYLPVIDSPIIHEHLKSYYPAVYEALLLDSEIVAVPFSLYTAHWGIDQVLFDMLAPDKLPHTYIEFAQLIQWYNMYFDNLDVDFNITYSGQDNISVIREMLATYILQTETRTEPLSFDNADFRSTMEALKSLPTKIDAPEDEEWWNEMINRPSLLNETPRQMNDATTDHAFTAILPPVVSSDKPPVLYGQMMMYVLNPNSKNREAAIRFLEYVVLYQSKNDHVQFSPLDNQPVENPSWGKIQTALLSEIAQMEARLLTCEENEKYDITRQIEKIKSIIDNEIDRYYITQEEINAYQSIMPYLRFGESSNFLGFNSGSSMDELMRVIERYIADQISLDETIRLLDRIAHFVFFENEGR